MAKSTVLRLMSFCIMLLSEVRVRLPPLPTMPIAGAKRSEVASPTVMMTWLAPRPRTVPAQWRGLLDRGDGVGGSYRLREFTLHLDRVDGDDVGRPGHRRALTALTPIPPVPTTTTVSPAETSATLTADPQPVATPHEHSETASRGTSRRRGRQGFRGRRRIRRRCRCPTWPSPGRVRRRTCRCRP